MYKNKQNLQLEIQTPFSLNFLIYVQNCFLNTTKKYESPKFPYIPSEDGLGLLLNHEEFANIFNEIWNEVLLNYNQIQDKNNNNEKNQLLVQSLFTNQEKFNEFFMSFSAWWKGLTGQLALQNFLSNEKIDKLYENLQEVYKINSDIEKNITIYLIYDNCRLLSSQKKYENKVVLSIEDIVMKRNLVERFKHLF